jgi:hypothetical protein
MSNDFALGPLLLSSLILSLAGCRSRPAPDPEAAAPPIAWSEEAIDFHGTTIKLGFRGGAAADRLVEPVVTIMRNGAPVPGAMVFIASMTANSKATQHFFDETPALYEPPTQQTPALYSAGRLRLPKGALSPAVRVRIVLPDAEEELIHEIPLPP